MGDSWRSSPSSSNKVKLVVIAIVVASGIVDLLRPRTSSWVFSAHAHPPPPPWLSSPPQSPTTPNDTVLSTTQDKGENGNGKEEMGLYNASNGPEIAPSNNEKEEAKPRKKYSNLERLEAGLAQARAAIRYARYGNLTHHDPDYVPIGPMYRNATAFLRSYREMEKQMKVYVYEEGEPPVFHYGLSKGVLGLEGIFIHQMEISPFRTPHPHKAHLFFLPFSVISLTNFVYVVDSRAWDPMKNTIRDYVNLIASKHPFWNRSKGADHFMLACHDWGPEISFGVPYLYKHSIRALCNANTSERFHPSRDVSIPEIYLPAGNTDGLLGGPSPSKRPILVFFAGGVHGHIRALLLQHWENKDPDVQVQKYLPKGVSYYDMIRKSRFCICPSGYEVASPRMVEALYMGCVPVLLKDHYVAPFSDVLDWKAFSVEVPVKAIPEMKKILEGISPRKYLKMQRRGLQVRRHFEVNFPPRRFDVFHMILHSIWLRRLNVRVYDSEDS